MAASSVADMISAVEGVTSRWESQRSFDELGRPLRDITFCVVDLETTGLRPGSSRICEIGAVRVREFELAEEFELLVDPGVPLGPTISALTGLHDSELRGQPHPGIAVRRFLEFAGDAVLVAHNARFGLGFIPMDKVIGRAFVIVWPPSRIR